MLVDDFYALNDTLDFAPFYVLYTRCLQDVYLGPRLLYVSDGWGILTSLSHARAQSLNTGNVGAVCAILQGAVTTSGTFLTSNKG